MKGFKKALIASLQAQVDTPTDVDVHLEVATFPRRLTLLLLLRRRSIRRTRRSETPSTAAEFPSFLLMLAMLWPCSRCSQA